MFFFFGVGSKIDKTLLLQISFWYTQKRKVSNETLWGFVRGSKLNFKKGFADDTVFILKSFVSNSKP